MQSTKALLLDGSRFSCLRMESTFRGESDIAFRYATDVDAALDLAESYLPTVLLLTADSLPDQASEETLSHLRQHPSTAELPILVLVEEDDARRSRLKEIGASSCLDAFAPTNLLLDQVRSQSARFLRSRRRQTRKSLTSELARAEARVLMVDDSRTICRSFAAQLQSEQGVLFDFCTDPTDAIARAKSFRPTVVLLDLEMPKISGFELLEALRAEASLEGVPVIVLSGLTETEYKLRAFRLGANDYAEKQMDQVELISRIRYHSRAYISARRLDESIHELLETKKQLERQRDFVRNTFGRYLSDEVVARILETPEGLELGGEKRPVSIMMSDLRGFTSMSERLSPEVVLHMINNYLAAMTEILLRYNGTIDEFIGDAILAVFGAPIARDDDALRAVACAVEMQQRMEEVNAWNREQGYPQISMGIGVHTGEVVVGNIGSERRAKYGVVGSNVNLTSRVESYTVGGQILVTEETHAACDGLLTIGEELEVSPKGVIAPITLYDVRGVGGDYRLRLAPSDNLHDLRRLRQPIDVQFCRVVGKDLADCSSAARILAIGLQMADIETADQPPPLRTDIRLALAPAGERATDEIYAKVIAHDPAQQLFRIHFTAIGPKVASFLEALPREKTA